LGYIELIDRVGTLNAQQREFIRRAQFSVKNITSLIDDLLDLGRIEAGYDTQKEVVPIPVILEYPLVGLRSRMAAKEQQLIVDLPGDLPPILGNIARLHQMISNLIDNSIKYTQEKGQITIRARTEGDQIILQVSDNGPGIPPADQPFIFDKFFRGSNINYDGIPGTGLGLAIVRSIVENHQGRIWAESALGKGSTFTIVLPAACKNAICLKIASAGAVRGSQRRLSPKEETAMSVTFSLVSALMIPYYLAISQCQSSHILCDLIHESGSCFW
jgi:two-component system NtrC family sensor kinase